MQVAGTGMVMTIDNASGKRNFAVDLLSAGEKYDLKLRRALNKTEAYS